MEEGNDSSVQGGGKPKAIPPNVITVDTTAQKDVGTSGVGGHGGHMGGPGADGNSSVGHSRGGGGGGSMSVDAASQARTPKHANKNTDEQRAKQHEERERERDREEHERRDSSRDPHGHQGSYHSSSFPPPPRPFDGRMGGTGAFQPHDRHSHSGYGGRSLPPMQVSPGGGRYYPGQGYGGPGPGHGRYGPPGHGPPPPPPPPQYDQHYQHGPPPPPGSGYQRGPYGPPHGGPPPPHMYPGHGQQYPGAGYDPAGPSWGLPPTFPHGRPPSYPSGPPGPPYSHNQGPPPPHHHPHGPPPPEYSQRQHQHPPSTKDSTFSRTISSSFDRSIRSREDSKMSTASTAHHHNRPDTMDVSPHLGPQQNPPYPPSHHHPHPPHYQHQQHPHHHHRDGDNQSLSGDASWGQLNQVASVDEDEMRKRMSKRSDAETPEADKEVAVTRSASNSSSLTNSPTEGVDVKKPAKLPSSLDSLSSVASAQAPMVTKNNDAGRKSLSPSGGSAGSLDLNLMKCPSGSSALLLPSHQRHDSAFSFSGENANDREDRGGERTSITGKRSHDAEDRCDVDTKVDHRELRKAPSTDAATLPTRPSKKGRMETKGKPKSSPLSIECSPPTSPTDRRKTDVKIKQPQPVYRGGREGGYGHHHPPPPPPPPPPPHHHHHHHPGAPPPVRDHHHSHHHGHHKEDPYYDKAPSHTYSTDSAPPRDREQDLPVRSERPGSASSTITPMNVTESLPESRQPGVGQIPSWDIQPQDSFGASSANPAGALMSSFSFSQDYPMLAASASIDHGHSERGPPVPPPPLPPEPPSHPPIESRNQSFEGGHYHGGSFSRSDSMMSYEGHGPSGMSYDGRGGPPPGNYPGPFPPHAPSWGSTSSYPQGGYPGHPHYQNYPPPMMRNYSEDSGARTSPPNGPHGMRGHGGMHRGFQPPPEFRAPPSMVPKTAPQAQHIISSPYGGKQGSYGWSKEEDMRLTDIMKKYKNPRDWEPIAKEHNCGRSAKECHERWIRYLKPGVRKGQWTDHEDAIVMEVVTSSTEQPFTRWSDLAQRLPGRVGKQIRDRWVNHLNPNINHLPFSREDDLLLWEGHKKLGKRWVEISTKYFNSSRSENHIKNRWYSASFKKFISNEFGPEAYTGGKLGKKESPNKKKKGDKSSSSNSSVCGSPEKGAAADMTNVEAV